MAFFLAWAVGQAIVIYRTSFAKDGQGGPPWPGQLAMSSGVFAILAVIAEAGPGARKLAITMSWGFNTAAFMNLTQTRAGAVVWNSANKVVLPAQAGPGWWKTLTSSAGWQMSDCQIMPTEGAPAPCTAAGKQGNNILGIPTGPTTAPAGTPTIPMPASGKCPPGYTPGINVLKGRCVQTGPVRAG